MYLTCVENLWTNIQLKDQEGDGSIILRIVGRNVGGWMEDRISSD
jgi:hypothetical protein